MPLIAVAWRRARAGFRMNTWEEINRRVVTSQPRYGVLVNHVKAAANAPARERGP